MDQSQKRIIAVLASLIVVALLVLLGASIVRVNNARAGNFTPPPFDEAAVVGAPEALDAALNYRPILVEGAFSASMCFNLTAKDGKVDLYFTNAPENTVWLTASVFDASGALLGETGILRPGEYVQTLTLNKQPSAAQNVTVRIRAYEPDTYYSKGFANGSLILNVSD